MFELWRFYLAFFAFWVGLSLGFSWVGGWHALARCYRSLPPFSGRRFWTQAGMRCGVSYSVRLASNTEGLFLSVMPVFRIGNPPLFMPWSQITILPREVWFGTCTRFLFRGVQGVPLDVRTGVATKLLANAPSGFAA
jgi:hypothetical protein